MTSKHLQMLADLIKSLEADVVISHELSAYVMMIEHRVEVLSQAIFSMRECPERAKELADEVGIHEDYFVDPPEEPESARNSQFNWGKPGRLRYRKSKREHHSGD